jgi:hypothetical protein
MTDKELLELAAKAAGVECKKTPIGFYLLDEDRNWNPLADDGDALRLALKLMEFEPYKSRGYLPTITSDVAATRRAITRAAAEIGKAMP